MSEHEHEHGHGHGHGHGHEHGDEHGDREEIPEKVGAGKILFFDTPSGAAGDMIVSALLDLGAPMRAVECALATLPIQGYDLHRGRRTRSGVTGASFEVRVHEAQPPRRWSDIDGMLGASSLGARLKALAREVFRTLAEAEAKVHGIAPGDVHFHEVGAVDAIADIVGAAALVTWIDPAEVQSSPLPLGHGMVRSAHGLLPLPAPAALEILRGVPTYGVPVEAELVTPTGAAILKTLAKQFGPWPAIVPERIGVGTGSREIEARPNMLRAVLGKRPAEPGATAATSDAIGTHVVVEANVDDMTGELAAHAMRLLLEQGALDVWATPTTTKKGRPGLVIGLIADDAHAPALERALLRETTTIGVRSHVVARLTRPRTLVTVATPWGEVPVKVSGGGYGPDQAKPEFDACARVAREAGVPVREVIAAAMRAYETGGRGRE